MDQGELRFEVVKSKISFGAYFQDVVRPRFGGGFADYSGRGTTVVAENAAGEKRVVAVAKRSQEARDKAVAMADDLKNLGAAAWSERYDVPVSFVTG